MLMFWNAPVFVGGCASVPVNGFPPSMNVSLHTYFFIPSDAGTQGPPDSLQPGEPAIASSSPSRSASVVAYLNASFHSGVMYTKRLSTTCGVSKAASKFWKPATPTRCIHSRSSLMPSLVMLPFIQCHHTRGRAPSGGFSKPLFSESVVLCAAASVAPRVRQSTARLIFRSRSPGDFIHIFISALPCLDGEAVYRPFGSVVKD